MTKYAEKCPACHTKASPGSYRCPHCKIYFCVRCGAHLRKDDKQFYCQTTGCPYAKSPLCIECASFERKTIKAFILFKLLNLDSDQTVTKWTCPECRESTPWVEE